MQEVDAEGLDKQDRRYLETLIRVFRGGPDRRRGPGRHDERVGRHPERRSRALPAPPRVRGPLASRPPGHAGGLSPPGASRAAARARAGSVRSFRFPARGSSTERRLGMASHSSSASGRVARRSRSRTACHSGRSGGMTTTIELEPERVAPVQHHRRAAARPPPAISSRIRRSVAGACGRSWLAQDDHAASLRSTRSLQLLGRFDAKRRGPGA